MTQLFGKRTFVISLFLPARTSRPDDTIPGPPLVQLTNVGTRMVRREYEGDTK